TNLRCDDTFVQDEGWNAACERYENFIRQHKNDRILLLELGVGGNTPAIIKYPFWRFTSQNPKATYACINFGEAICHEQIEKQSICINEDIGKVISRISFS
ncbi:MAG: Sir2 silent information regulator family NAD-dependent deacetylase, partial [Clostridia bacterium]|nr:Sir2 silent information regulator family NAD-dependent deacetylase [Clostridia bacterium]